MMKKKVMIIAAAVVVLGAGAFYLLNQRGGLQVNGALVSLESIEAYVEETGTVVPRNHIQVYSPVAGKVTEVTVDVGDWVNEGDVLARLDGEALANQLAQLDAQRAAALAGLNEARRAGDANAIRSLQLDIDQLSRTVQEAEKDLEDMKTLYEAGAISQDQLTSAERALQSQRTNLEKLKLQLNQLTSPVSQNIIAQYEAQIRQIDLQKQDLESSGEDFTIVSATRGTVLGKMVERGSFLQPGMSLMEIGDTEDLFIQCDILVSEITDVRENLPVRIENRDLGIEGTGMVTKIYPNAFSKISDLGVEQKRIRVQIELDLIPDGLRPGYDLLVKVVTESSENTLVIPESALFSMDGKEYVFVDENGLARLRQVQIGIRSGRKAEMLQGLQEGEVVILSPGRELEEGASIVTAIQQ